MKRAEMFSPLMLERFWNKVQKTDTCWFWTGCTNIDGGILTVCGKKYRPHRVSYNISFGEIPENKIILQTCKNILCVNPLHLIINNGQNQEMKKTHCPNGHPYSGKNNQGKRICHECQRKRMYERYHNPKSGQKEYQLKYLSENKASINENSKKWHRNNKQYFRDYEKDNPRSGSHYPIEERFIMTRRRLMDGNICQWSKCDKPITPQNTIQVNHIFPRAEYPNLELDIRFFITYCQYHHAEWHRKRGDSYWKWIATSIGEQVDE